MPAVRKITSLISMFYQKKESKHKQGTRVNIYLNHIRNGYIASRNKTCTSHIMGAMIGRSFCTRKCVLNPNSMLDVYIIKMKL